MDNNNLNNENTEIVADASNAQAKMNNQYYLTLQQAFDAAGDGDTITLIRDVPMQTMGNSTHDVELDLNGHQIFKHSIVFNGNSVIRDSGKEGAIISDVVNNGNMKNYAKVAGGFSNTGHLMNSGVIDKLTVEDGVVDNAGVVNKGTMKGGAYHGDSEHITYIASIGDVLYGSLAAAANDANTAAEDQMILVHERSQLKETVNLKNPDITMTIDMNGKTFLNGTIDIASKVVVIDSSKRKKGNVLSNVSVDASGELDIDSTVSGNIENRGKIINKGVMAGTNTNFGILINEEDGEVTDTLISEGTVHNSGEMDYLYVRGGEADSDVEIRNVTVLAGHYRGDVTAVECKAAIGNVYYGDAFEAIHDASVASSPATVMLYKETKLKEPLVLDNPTTLMTLDINGQEVSGESITIKHTAAIVNHASRPTGSLFNTIMIEKDATLTFDAEITKSMECYGYLINKGKIPYLIMHSGNAENSGEVKKVVLEAGATFTGLAEVINSEAMIGKRHYMTFDEALSTALNSAEDCTLSLLSDYSIESELSLEPKATLTLNLNNHHMTGGPLNIKGKVKLDNSGEQGEFDCPVINSGTLENHAHITSDLDNTGTLINNANINAVINTGEIENSFVITSLQLTSGKVVNKGTLSKVVHSQGEIVNEGAIDLLTIQNERVEISGNNPEETNANIKIDNAYYTSFEGAIDDMNKSLKDVSVGFVKDLEIAKELTIKNESATITFDLNNHKLTGAKLTIDTPVIINNGTVENDIENHSTLTNRGTISGYIRNLNKAINEGVMKRLDNKNSFENTGDIDTLVMKAGTCDNKETIRNLAMASGTLDSSGVIEVISQKGGVITNTGEVDHLEIQDGLFNGPLTSTNATVKIADTYYPSFAAAVNAAIESKKATTISLIDDVVNNQDLTIAKGDQLITIDLNKHTLSGHRVEADAPLTLMNGRLEANVVAQAPLTLDVTMTGDVINEDKMTVYNTVTGAILNKGSMINAGVISAINNNGTLTNNSAIKNVTSNGSITNNEDASIDALAQESGTLTNAGLVRNIQMSGGTLVSTGDIHYLNESGGSVQNKGELDTLTLSGGRFHGPVHSTNAPAHIDDDYYSTFEDALQVANAKRTDVTIRVIAAVIINNPVTIGAADHAIHIDVGDASLSGTVLNTIGRVTITVNSGIVKNRIVNKGDLTLNGNMAGAVTNIVKLDNRGTIASLINNGTAHNHGTLSSVTNTKDLINNQIIKKITNTGDFINNAHVDEIVQNGGTFRNKHFVDTCFMNKGQLFNEERVVKLKQYGGEVLNSKQVENLDMEGGRYEGEVEVSNAIAAIGAVRYARLNEAVADANQAATDIEISLRDHAQVLDQLTIGNKDHTITINTNQSNIVGEMLTCEKNVVLTGYGKVMNGLYNKGELSNDVTITGEIFNEGHIVNKKKLNGTVNNLGTIDNEESIESLINKGTLNNLGTIHAFTQTSGETMNKGLVQDVILDDGTVENNGTLSRITQKGGQSVNKGTVHTLVLSRGTFTGPVEDTNALARINDTYYPYLEDAMNAAGKANEDVTVTLNNDVAIGEVMTIDNPSHLITLDLDEHTIDGGVLKCHHDVMIINGTILPKVENDGHLKSNATFENVMTNDGEFILDGHSAHMITNHNTTQINGIANAVTNTKKLTNDGVITSYVQDDGTLDNNGSINTVELNAGSLINGGGAKITTIAQSDGSITNFGTVDHLAIGNKMVVFKGNPPKETNAEAKILTNYYRYVTYAIEQANHTREGVKVILNSNVEIQQDVLFYNTEKAMTLDLAGFTLSGASMTVATEVTFMGEGEIRNAVEVTGKLINQASVSGETAVHGTLINEAHMASVTSNGEIVNKASSAIESLTCTDGTLENDGSIASLHLEKAAATSSGYIEAIAIYSGELINTGKTKAVSMTAGTFTGQINKMSCAAAIKDTYYGQLSDAILAANSAKADVELVILDDHETPSFTLGNPNGPLTVDFHAHHISGETITIKDQVIFKSSQDDGYLDNALVISGELTSEIIDSAHVLNSGTLINNGAMNDQIENRKKMENNGHMALVINAGELTNKGVIDHLTFDEGSLDNEGEISSIVMSKGKLVSSGKIDELVQNNGTSISSGTLSHLTLNRGTFTGTLEKTNALVRVDHTYYPTFTDALESTRHNELVTTITLNDDIEIKEPLTLEHDESLLIQLAGHDISGESLTCANDVRILDDTDSATVKNELLNKGTLCLDVHYEGKITNTTYFNNRGETSGRVINNGTLTNDGHMHEIDNYQRVENNGTIDDISNHVDFINNKTAHTLKAESRGTIKNDGLIEELHMTNGKVTSAGTINKIVQERGEISSTGKVMTLDTTGGHFTGNVGTTNAQGSIGSTYYATLEELLNTASNAQQDVTVRLNRDIESQQDLLMTNKAAALTVDFNGYDVHSASVTTIHDVTLENSARSGGELAGELFNKGTLLSVIRCLKPVTNDGTLTNKGAMEKVINNDTLTNNGQIEECVNNETMTNTSLIDAVINHKDLTNGDKGKISSLHQENGMLINSGSLHDMTLNGGALENKGKIYTLSQNDGQVTDHGEITHVILTSGTYNGPKKDIESVARIGNNYYGSLQKAFDAANNSDADVTVCLNGEAFSNDIYEISNAHHTVTLELNGWGIHGVGLRILSQAVIQDRSVGQGDLDLKVLNKGTLVNDAIINGDVRNTGTLTNNGYIDTIYNHGTLTNSAVLDVLIQKGGHTTNQKTLHDLDMRRGSCLNVGHIDRAILDGGEIHSKGTMSEITLYNGHFDGEADYVDNYED